VDGDGDADGGLERRRAREAAAGLWPIGRALMVAGCAALSGLAIVTVTALAVLGFPRLAAHRDLSVGDLLDVLKLVLGTVAGVGALAALVMNYRKQRLAEVGEVREHQRELREQQHADDDRVRVFNERFASAAGQLGHAEPAVRLAGIYAMAGLADDWRDGRQTCIDVLCAYLRMPYGPRPKGGISNDEYLAFGRNQEVRHTVISIISAHLRDDARISWQGHDFDFTGVQFDGGNFSYARFSGGTVSFSDAGISGSGLGVNFRGAMFSGGAIDFSNARFTGGKVHFSGAEFTGGAVAFSWGSFSCETVDFSNAEFSGGTVTFDAIFHEGTVDFSNAKFSGSTVDFGDAMFGDGTIDFSNVKFSGGTIDFSNASFTGGTVDLRYVKSSGGTLRFHESAVSQAPPGLLLPSSA
jgi:uncharacterized protein YjbI with pentapeptide repeats